MPIITASHLYDHVACPHRVQLDNFGQEDKRDEISSFVKLLWERGSIYEASVVSALPYGSYISLRDLPAGKREEATLDAIRDGAPLIYGGRIAVDDLLGEPDLLIKRNGGYLAADIKSGQGEADGDEGSDGKLKPHYAVQVALYTDILQRLGFGVGRVAEIWDVKGRHVLYELDLPRHTRTTETWWDVYTRSVVQVRSILEGTSNTKGALAAACKLCHWYSFCREELTAAGDLTLIPSLGRAIRDSMSDHLGSINEFADCNPEGFIVAKKTTIPKLGVDRLRLFHKRAQLLTDPAAKPFLREVVTLPSTELEIFFDIEADPMNDIVYLHGFVERTARDPATEKFTAFFADANTEKAEHAAFAGAIAWMKERPGAAIYYYSKYERTMYRKLCERFPDVCSPEDIEELFRPPRSIDLYFDVVTKATEWPTTDHSIKTLAKYLGFAWRDIDPSGAASIEWYQRWVETGDQTVRQRILDYNEDDCRATAVLLDGVRELVSLPRGTVPNE
jgi:predicted RecB family nuclease